MSDDGCGATVDVLYVLCRNAKAVKVCLEKEGLLHKQYRMTKPTPSSLRETCIAIPVPVKKECIEGPWKPMVVSVGRQYCPYSSSFLGNHKNACLNVASSSPNLETQVQRALLSALIQCPQQAIATEEEEEVVQRIKALSVSTCPKKLEVIGDDRTLVIPQKAFREDDEQFSSLVALVVGSEQKPIDWTCFWKHFASSMNSPRVVRRGDIGPDSGIRESGHRLLWPYDGQPDETGPGSPGWITITEQGISQSFDMTRVMFSRGNITEKIRFGKLVKENEIVLDMYAGIGYYTLPALVHGKAGHVYACEWNEHAANALKHNLAANGVEDRATVLEGDCRQLALKFNLVKMFDRVSLGLLPSSEGGWRTAIKALRTTTGGWLHVHGNVPDQELRLWKFWISNRLLGIVDEEREESSEWVVVCVRVERVKSFAPQIHHFVADVFVGPMSHLSMPADLEKHRSGVLLGRKLFEPSPQKIDPPSCALSPIGVLHQAWMVENCADEAQSSS